MILELNSTIIKLKEVIHQKEDVEAQLAQARSYISNLEQQQ